MTYLKLTGALLATTLLATGAFAQNLTIESWRNDDLTLWQDKIIPAFEAPNPGITVKFAPSAPAEYNAVLNSKLDAGSAGDLITCRPFDASLALYDAGHLRRSQRSCRHGQLLGRGEIGLADRRRRGHVLRADGIGDPRLHLQQGRLRRTGAEGADHRRRILRRARRDQGGRQLYPDGDGHQRPVGSRHHGLQQHRPELLEGRGRPPGPDRRRAEADRRGWVAPYATLANWGDYLGDGFEAQTYPDSQNIFTLGRAAIYPGGHLGDLGLQRAGRFRDGRVQAAGAERGRHLLYLGPHRHRHGPERRVAQCRGRAHLPRLDGHRGVRHDLRQRAAGLLLAVELRHRDGGPAGAGIRVLAR